ncbi:HAD family hydrolase [Pedobacter arcticus]|uniref:HAD family hydrolase n=1 Tax=Pedobacter arcticus TaxID=752140 RepID=UPI000309E430|nr:HAD hydrolase-like protein [Pedobacter arcticus]
MVNKNPITTLFLDIGGVLLSDGWDHYARQDAAKEFKLNYDEMEERHRLNFETYELGQMTLATYLERVVFYQKRDFSLDDFKTFMFQQSLPHPEMISLFIHLKKKYGLKVGVISNEARELNEYRIKNFKLNEFVDFFVSSSFVNLRKPDVAIFSLAIDIAQINPSESIYIDNQPLFVEIGRGFGMKGISHIDYKSTVEKLKEFGLNLTQTTHG